MLIQSVLGALALASCSVAHIIPDDQKLWGPGGPPRGMEKRQASSATPAAAASATPSRVADSSCKNGVLTRQCWSNGYSAATDFDAKWPTTGKTVTYSLEITNGTCNPDGHGPRQCQLFNGQYPGPVISADWGDTLQITVKNSMDNNGTGIHWHGIRMLNNCPNDGVPGITECPLAPHDTKVYTFQATQFGTTWYHSHWSAQYGEGAFGSVVINGPASANYDIDLGPYILNDYYYPTSWEMGLIATANLQQGRPPPPADNIIINGTAKSSNGTAGAYYKTSVKKGKKYRVRLINASMDNNMRVSLDGHQFQVISSDLVPIKPYNTNWVLLAVGQRYDVIINANQAVGNYWFRATVATDCASSNAAGTSLSIFSYEGAGNGDPTSTGTTPPSVCKDESPLVPWVANTVDSTAFKQQVGDLSVDISRDVTTNGQNIVHWSINLQAINVDWEKPTMQYVMDGNTSYPSVFNLIEIPNEGTWSFWIIQEPATTRVPIPHPIHLHGHDFYVLGAGAGQFNKTTTPDTLTYYNPPRRDTAILPGGGWLAIAFPADNPGAWLMHCHIAWHVADGLAVQFLESKNTMPTGDANWKKTCQNWNNYYPTAIYKKVDSGL